MSDFKKLPDSVRRRKQAAKYARILFVREIMGDRTKIPPDEMKRMAEYLKCSDRTIRRDVETINICREINEGYKPQ